MSSHPDRIIVPDYEITEHYFKVPLDHLDLNSPTIKIFARICVPIDRVHEQDKLPFMNFINGGPGMSNTSGNRSIFKEIYSRGYKMIFIDQRGTGLSSPISGRFLQKKFKTAQERADYLKYFRADNIVRDFEKIRLFLLGHKKDEERKWSLLGQSFGGFVITTYLSLRPEGVKEALITGGLPPLTKNPDAVYSALYPRVIERNKIYYKKFPQDVEKIRTIMKYVSENEVKTPNNGHLTPSRLQFLGIDLGMHGGTIRLHDLMLEAYNDLELTGELGYRFLTQVEGRLDAYPLYAILHEPIYCQGNSCRWASQRLKPLELNAETSLKADTKPVYFTAENIYPSMYDDFAELRGLKDVAEILAEYDDWPELYNERKLKENKVPVAAVVYYDDIFVDMNLSLQTAKLMGAKVYITNRYLHDGIREESDLLAYLFKLLRGDGEP